MKPIFKLICCIVFSFFFTASKAQKSADLPADLDNYIKTVLAQFEVPGLSIAIVKDGRVLKAAGYGEKN